MIKPSEIQQKARSAEVRDQQIEKDYVLSWILNGIAQHKELSKLIVFKGGTVLKKIYFEDYRFSEDLDFTLLDNNTPNELIFSLFRETFAFVKEEANIPLEIIDNNEHEDGGINFYISYVGPLGGQGNNKSVKVDISRSEQLVFTPVMKSAFICYTDLEEYQLLCYPLEEVLVEKMRSVDTTGIEPLAHPLGAIQDVTLRLREDRVSEPNNIEANQRNAPAVENGLFLVPKVIE